MIDTIDIYSEKISPELYAELLTKSVIKTARHQIEDKVHILYEFANCTYQNSYSSKILISLCTEKWIYNERLKIAEKITCSPYLRIVGSLHKFFLGTNVFGGSDNLKYQVLFLLNSIEKDMELINILPGYDSWFINRIDYAKIYNVGTQKNVLEYFNSLQNVKYPRSKTLYFEGESIYKGGRATSIKIYNKMAEYKRNDYKRWKKMHEEKANAILDASAPLIRCEVEIKKPKLQYDFKKQEIKLNEINKKYMDKIYKIEIYRMLNEGEEMNKIKNNAQVRMILQNQLSSEMSRLVYGFYNDLCLNGYKAVKETLPKTTYYRYQKILKELGINYINHDIKNENVVYFNPLTAQSYDLDLICDLDTECI